MANIIIPKISIPIYENYIQTGHPNRPGTKLTPTNPLWDAIVFHATGNFNEGATDTMNTKYIGRTYKTINGVKYEADGKTPFRLAGAQVFVDCDSVTICIPLDEVTWACGDRQRAWDAVNKGQQKLARQLFDNKQNYRTLSIEICDNKDWETAKKNAIEFVAALLVANKKVITSDKFFLRHYDLTYKTCPSRMVDTKIVEVDPRWVQFKKDLYTKYNEFNSIPKYRYTVSVGDITDEIYANKLRDNLAIMGYNPKVIKEEIK